MLLTKQAMLDARENVPTFQESGIRHDSFHFYGTNQESYEWLHIITYTLARYARERQQFPLQLVPAAKAPKLIMAEVQGF